MVKDDYSRYKLKEHIADTIEFKSDNKLVFNAYGGKNREDIRYNSGDYKIVDEAIIVYFNRTIYPPIVEPISETEIPFRLLSKDKLELRFITHTRDEKDKIVIQKEYNTKVYFKRIK